MRLNRLKSKVVRAKCEQMVANVMKIELQTKIIKDHIEMPITIDALTRTHTNTGGSLELRSRTSFGFSEIYCLCSDSIWTLGKNIGFRILKLKISWKVGIKWTRYFQTLSTGRKKNSLLWCVKRSAIVCAAKPFGSIHIFRLLTAIFKVFVLHFFCFGVRNTTLTIYGRD